MRAALVARYSVLPARLLRVEVPVKAAGLTEWVPGPLALRPHLAAGVPCLAVRLADTSYIGLGRGRS